MEYTPVAQRTGGGSSRPNYVPVGERATTTPAVPTTPKKPVGFFESVASFFGGKKEEEKPAEPVMPKRLTYTPVSMRATTTPEAPATPAKKPNPVLSAIGAGLNKASTVIDDAISISPEEEQAIGKKKSSLERTLSYLPSEFARNLPFGVGALISQIQDDPETASKIGLSDVAKEVPGVVVETGKEFIKMPVAGALDVVGSSAQAITGGKYNGQISFEIPGLGTVSNAQFRAAERINNGEEPVKVALEESAGAIFETLFFMDVATAPFRGRPTKTAEFRTEGGKKTPGNALPEGTGPQIVKEMPKGPVDTGPKSFRLYEKPVVQQALPPSVIARMQEQGINLGPRFNPDLPTYFRVSPGPKGTVVAEVMQVRPSIFSTVVRGFKGKGAGATAAPETPSAAYQHIKQSEGMNVDEAIRNGDIPANMVYQNQAKGTLSPEYAKGRIQDVAQKLDRYQPGLGAKYKASLDPASGLTMDAIEGAGVRVLDAAVAEGVLKLPAIPPAGTVPAAGAVGTIPREDVEVLYSQTADPSKGAVPVVDKPATPEARTTPKTPEDAVATYYEEVLKPETEAGGPSIIGADDLKDFFGKDYDAANHPIYSRAAYLLYEKMLKENPGDVILTGGGPASGKTEILVKELKDAGFTGVLYDSNMANFEGVVKQIEAARELGKDVVIAGITPDLASARTFSVQREQAGGRSISDKTFARGHTGFPQTVSRLIEEGIIDADHVQILDTRHNPTLQEAKEMVRTKKFVIDPFAHTRDLGYNEDNVKATYSKDKYARASEKPTEPSIVPASDTQAPGEGGTNRGVGPGNRPDVPGDNRTQRERVAEEVATEAKSIKEVADATGILEPNVRRILGTGAKDGTFERVDKGVYVLKKANGEEVAWIEAGDAVNVLPRLASEGKKFDMIFLDPAYYSRALIGGNRGIKEYEFIQAPEFKKVMEAVSKLTKKEDTHVYLMLSGARTAQNDMLKYTEAAVDTGFIPVGEGSYKKLNKDGSPVSNVRGEEAAAERLILFTQSGVARAGEVPIELEFRFIRPSVAKSYSTEKPKELLNALIKQSTLEGETVLDPFAGSGVAGEQAIKEGRKPYLVEKKPEVVEDVIKPRVAGAMKEYDTIHEGGVIKKVEGEPVEIVAGIETFVHKGDGGFVVSEASSGRFVSESRSKEGAIAKAKVKISEVGEEKFRSTIAANKLPADTGEKLQLEAVPKTEEQMKEKRPAGFNENRITKADLKTLVSTGEFGENPVFTVRKEPFSEGIDRTFLEFQGKSQRVSINAKAFKTIDADKLQDGEKITVSKEMLGGKDAETEVRVVKYSGGGKGIYADVGAFRDGTPIKAGSLDKVQPFELPELVQLARDLLGEAPKIRKKLGKSLGYFKPGVGNGEIKLRADIFEDIEQTAKILGHEIGHLVDYLPDQMMKRGNLLGRLFSLRRFMASTFSKETGKGIDTKKLRNEALGRVLKREGLSIGDYINKVEVRGKVSELAKTEYKEMLAENSAIKNADIKNELSAFSAYWRPWDIEKSTDAYNAYRKRPTELYADALSGLFNSPGLLQEMAPTFYREFFSALDRKPEVRDAYFQVQSLLSGDREALVKSRREGVRTMFDEGDMKAQDVQNVRQAKRKESNEHVAMRLKYELLDKNAPIIKRIDEIEKNGGYVNPDENPLYFLEERSYLGGKIKAYAEDFNAVYQELRKDGIDWNTFGELLFYERVASGDRSKQANPRGITPDAAQELINQMKVEMGDEAFAKLNASADKFREITRVVSEEAYKEGLYSKELYDNMQANPKYATFQVLDYIEQGVSAKVFKSVGTLKDIANPADSSILKTMSTIRAIERNKVHRATIDFIAKEFPGETREADKRFSGKGQTYVESKKPDEEVLVFVYRDGKAIGYYVDPYTAASLANNTIGYNWAVINGFRFMNSALYRPLFITYSTGFQLFNFLRDFQRFYKNIPDMTLARAAKRYIQSVPMAQQRAFGISKNPTAKELEVAKALQDLERSQVFGFTFNDMMDGAPSEEKQIERILRQSGLDGFSDPKADPKVWKRALSPFIKVLDVIKRTGDFIETLPKAAGYYELTNKNTGKELDKEQKAYIRKYLGSPDFLAGGALKPATNEIFLFSNAIAQGIRADYHIATQPKTRGAYWRKTIAINIIPKLLMYLAALGVLGKVVQDAMNDATEYDKTNYTIIPLGRDEGTNKAVYLRFPSDETGRLIGGVLWKALTAAENEQPLTTDVMNLIDFTGGQLPSITPTITAVGGALDYASGRNPYDAFRGRNVISEDVFKAGGWRSFQSFLGWEFQQMGGGVFIKFYNEPTAPKAKGPVETFVGLPIISNVVGRFIRATDYGRTEDLNAIQESVEADEIRQRLADNDVVREVLTEALKDPNVGANKGVYERQLREAITGGEPMTPETQARLERVKERFRLGLIRGEADAETTALINAQTNNQKAELLLEIKRQMGDEFPAYLAELRRNGIVSPDVINKLKQIEE